MATWGRGQTKVKWWKGSAWIEVELETWGCLL